MRSLVLLHVWGCLSILPASPVSLWAAQDEAASEGGNVAALAFLQKVQLHNFGGVEPSEDGQGVWLFRLPAPVRDQLDTVTPSGQERDGAGRMRLARHSEIRFVLQDGETPDNVLLHLQSTQAAEVTVFWGDVWAGSLRLRPGAPNRPLRPMSHGLLNQQIENFPQGRFANRVCRVVIDGGEVLFLGIEGDVRPPKPEELAPVMLSYGTSISQGASASRTDLAWNALTARALGYDLLNLGSAGSAFCEPAIADYMAGLSWDLAVLEISVNMAGTGFSVEQFKERARYMIDTLAASHPDAPIFCISLFPYGTGDLWSNNVPRTQSFRDALHAVVQASGHDNVHFVSGPDLLHFTGLSADLLHPSDHGMIEIANQLSARIRRVLDPSLPGDEAGRAVQRP